MSHTPGPPPEPPHRPHGQHLATVSHQGRFWDVFLEFNDDPRRPDVYRALLCFAPSDLDSSEQPVRTANIIVESTYDDVVRKARIFEEHQLLGLLRSVLPD